ncbi:MAG: hypothetical protein AAGB93_16370 [Planctomycetota bacterium]
MGGHADRRAENAPARAAAALLALALAACGGDAADDARGDATRTSGELEVPVVTEARRGLLEVIDPTFPDRPYFHDTGELIYGERRAWITRFRNVGASPVEVLSAQPACGCTRLFSMTVTPPDGGPPEVLKTFDDRPITTVPVGGELELSVLVLSKFTTPNQRKLANFRLSTDSDLEPYITLEVSILATRPFIFAPTEAKLLNTPTSHGKEARVKVLVESPGDPGRVLGIESSPDGLEVDLVEETFAGEFVWYIDIKAPPLTPLGVIRGSVVLRTTDSTGEGDGGRLALPVICQVVPDVVMEKPFAALGAFKATEGTVFESRLNALVPGAKMRVLRTRIEDAAFDGIAVEVTPVTPDDDGRAKEWQVTVRVAPGCPPGFLTGDIVFELDEPIGGTRGSEDGTELRIRLSGRVLEA